MVIWRGKRYIHSEDGVVSVEFSENELKLLEMILEAFQYTHPDVTNQELLGFMEDMTWVQDTLEELEEERGLDGYSTSP